METFYTLTRSIPKRPPVDLFIAGGGPAGCAAALRAARNQSSVLLAEATGALGGMGTNGLVSNWYSLSDGKRILPKGIFWEIVSALYKESALPPGLNPHNPEWQQKLHVGTGFNPEILKSLLDNLCESAGVIVQFCTRLIDVDVRDGHVHGVILHNVEGYSYVPCKAVIDATGDAILADLAGVPCRQAGSDTSHIMPPTLCATVSDIDFDTFNRREYEQKVFQAVEQNVFSQADRHVPGIFRTGAHLGIQNAGHLFGMDALDVTSLSDGYRRGRKLAREYLEFARKWVAGCDKATLVSTATLMGVRESRCIHGVYELSYDDFQNRRYFDDQIAVYNKAVDIHVYDTSDEQWQRYLSEYEKLDKLGVGESYGLPYRMLISEEIDNLWVAGRCASSDLKVNGAVRDQPACYVMGEAAGLAASLAARNGRNAHSVDVGKLQDFLREGGSYLP